MSIRLEILPSSPVITFPNVKQVSTRESDEFEPEKVRYHGKMAIEHWGDGEGESDDKIALVFDDPGLGFNLDLTLRLHEIIILHRFLEGVIKINHEKK